MTRLLSPLFVLLVWLALWGEVTVVNVVSGLAVVGVIGLVFRPVPPRHTVHPLALIRLVAVFVWRLLSSSATVVVTVLAPSPARLRSGVVGVELSHPSPLVATIVADAISLTPGTLTLDVRYGDDDPAEAAPPVLYIHVLGLSDPDAIRDDVWGLERLVVSAVTPDPPEAFRQPRQDADPGEPDMNAVGWVSGVMLAAAGLLTTIHILRSRNLADRAVGVDMLVAIVLNGLAVGIAITQDDLVAALILIIGLLAFLGSVTIARYIEERGP